MNYLKNIFLYKMLYFARIHTSKRIVLIKEANEKTPMFVTFGIFQIKGLSFDHMDAVIAMIY